MSMTTRCAWLMGAMLMAACGDKSEAKHPESDMPAPTTTTTATAPAMTSSTMGAAGSPMTTSSASPMTTSSAMPMDAPKPAAKLSDAEIGAIMDAANGGEIEEAKVAQKNAKDAGVKSFATMMITHHTEARDKQAKLFAKASLTPSENDKSREVKATGQKNLATIQPLKGADFDRAYIDAQVKEHQTVLTMLDSQLIPNAQNADYKALLQEVRGRVEQHLKTAQDLQTKLGK